MIMSSLQLRRRYEFGPSIVWDGLVDPELVSGWLAEAVIEPELGGIYSLRSIPSRAVISFDGRVSRMEPRVRLEASTSVGASLDFTLMEVAGGNRGTSTLLNVQIVSPVDHAFAFRLRQAWLVSLDQLDELLHGHPVDWRYWDRDHTANGSRHRAEAAVNPDAVNPGAENPGSRQHPQG